MNLIKIDYSLIYKISVKNFFLIVGFFTTTFNFLNANSPYSDSLLDFQPSKVTAKVKRGYFATSNSNKISEMRLMNNIRKTHRDLYDKFRHSPKWIFVHPNDKKCSSLEYNFKEMKNTIEFTAYNVPDPNKKIISESQLQIHLDGKLIKSFSLRTSDFQKKKTINFSPFKRIEFRFCKLKEFKGSGMILLNPKVF